MGSDSRCVDGVACDHEACPMKLAKRGHDRRAILSTSQVRMTGKASQSCIIGLFVGIVLAACGAAPGNTNDSEVPESEARQVRSGIEVLLSDSLHLVQGQRVGLLTNHTGIYWTSDGIVGSTIDALYEANNVDLVALYAPEHGIRGQEQAGAAIDSGRDERTGVPIHSLYGEVRKPTPAMLEGVDVLLFDMQDIGARYYTYVSTMALAMEAAGEQDIPFIVLDRPNPVRGDVVQGNLLKPGYETFVGMYPVPMRHGMTVGELARLYVGEFGLEVDLHLVPLDGWTRDMTFDQTQLPWIPPSPNMPSLESALAYPGTCLFEGTPISVGRGTDRAFQWVGAPWLDGVQLAESLNGYGINGVRFESTTFTPRNSGDRKFEGQEVSGVVLIPESTDYDASKAAVAMLVETYSMSGDNWLWAEAHFDRLAGTDSLRLSIEAGADFAELISAWDSETQAFEQLRVPYLIYR
ncbi:MAG: hypothetical protein CME14_08120 [Gemmatimonadetes bacterium]|nr:hypothetical protein [Gemmatimonadota bacterium]